MRLADIPNPTNRIIASRMKRQGEYDHVFLFTPREDITAYELAMIVSGIDGHISIPIGVNTLDLPVMEPYARHFTEIEFG